MLDLIVSVPDHCLSFYFTSNKTSLCIHKQTVRKKMVNRMPEKFLNVKNFKLSPFELNI